MTAAAPYLSLSVDEVLAAHRATCEAFPHPDDDALCARVEASVRYAWEWCRMACLVSVRDWRVRCAVALCNRDAFRNDWDIRMPDGDAPDGDAPSEGDLPPDRWWCNADVLCTRPSSEAGWTLGSLPAYVGMLSEALRRHPVRHACFLLNRRDHPLVRRDGTAPYHHVYAPGRAPPRAVEDPERLLPVLSPYTDSAAFRDLVVPTDVDWTTRASAVPDVPWASRKKVAMWRGTATNPIRRALVDAFSDDPAFDVALTYSRGQRLVVRGGVAERQAPSGSRDAWIAPDDWTRFRVILAPDGHAGLNRWAHLARSGAFVVRISSSVAPECVLAPHVAHAHVDATRDGWVGEVRRHVRRFLRRSSGPRVTFMPDERVLTAAVAATLRGLDTAVLT